MVPVVEVSWGNAVDEGSQAGRRGWFIGHFLAPWAGPAATDMVEVKWGVHAAGEIKAIEGVNQTATTMSLLVSGRFRLDFPSHGRSVTLVRAGRLRGLVPRRVAPLAGAGGRRSDHDPLALTA